MGKRINVPDEAIMEALKNATDTIEEMEKTILQMNDNNNDMIKLVDEYRGIATRAKDAKDTEQRAKLQAYAFIANNGLIRAFKEYCEETQEYTWQMFHEAFLNAF